MLLNMKVMNKSVWTLICCCFLASCSEKEEAFGEKVVQTPIGRVEVMPDMPESYQMLDWKEKQKVMTNLFLIGIIRVRSVL